MAHKYILDTHALIWFVEGNKQIGERARAVLSSKDSEMILPIIALAEATLIIQRKRTTIPDIGPFLQRVYSDIRIEIFPLTLEILDRSLTVEGLRIPELHDRFIVSTGLHLQDSGDTVEIVTVDQAIQNAGVLPIVW